MNEELKNSIIRFVSAFEQVFDKDWEYTKEQLGIQDKKETFFTSEVQNVFIISPAGTFINPKVDDETEDWGHRGALLEEYRKLKQLLI